MVMEDIDFGGETIVLQYGLDLPFLDDSNNNGLLDFIDSSVAVAGEQTDGAYFNPANGDFEPMQAVWSRDAGTMEGVVQISLPQLGLTFLHSYRVPEFLGVLEFSRAGSKLQGQISITNVADSNDTITGPLTLTIQDPATLTYGGGTWSGPNAEVYQYAPEDNLDRIELNYLSFFDFMDGLPATTEQDYQFWLFNVESEDANKDGIPDVVQGQVTVVRPNMSVIKVPNGIQITITGTVGQTYQLQSTDRLIPNSWTDVQPVTLTTSPLTLTLPMSGTQRFYQLKQ
jgi:hypothetical protein